VPENSPVYQYPLQVIQEIPRGHLSHFRTGTISLNAEGVVLKGTVVYEDRQAILEIINTVTNAPFNEIFNHKSVLETNHWEQVEAILGDPDQKRVSILYRRPKNKTLIALTTKLSDEHWENFMAAARYFSAEKVQETNLRNSTSIRAVFGAIAVLILTPLVMLLIGLIALSIWK
jgi:hypothetical protein